MTASDPAAFKFPIIVGPTAGGKSALAVALAHAFINHLGIRAEIVTADAIQIYRGLDIGSAKPTLLERAGVPHHLIDIVDPTERFSVDAWLARAEQTLQSIRSPTPAGSPAGLPIVVGGTHLYVKALLDGLFDGPEPDAALRERLTAMDPRERRAELESADPAAAARIHPNDIRRTVRALEVFRLTGTPLTHHQQQWDTGNTRRDCVLVGLDWEPDSINRRINARVKDMIHRGLIDEARHLHRSSLLGVQAREALGYKQLIDHFEARSSLDDSIEAIKIETRRFAKNQRTWLRRLRSTPGSVWLDAHNSSLDDLVSRTIAACAPPSPV